MTDRKVEILHILLKEPFPTKIASIRSPRPYEKEMFFVCLFVCLFVFRTKQETCVYTCAISCRKVLVNWNACEQFLNNKFEYHQLSKYRSGFASNYRSKKI